MGGDGGTVRPSALAVFRLITGSFLVGAALVGRLAFARKDAINCCSARKRLAALGKITRRNKCRHIGRRNPIKTVAVLTERVERYDAGRDGKYCDGSESAEQSNRYSETNRLFGDALSATPGRARRHRPSAKGVNALSPGMIDKTL